MRVRTAEPSASPAVPATATTNTATTHWPRREDDQCENKGRRGNEPRPRGVAAEALTAREQEPVHAPECYIRSGASTPTRSRQRAMTPWVARHRPSLNAS